MKILVFGASGKTGQHLLTQALEKGFTVTAFARHPEKIKIEHHKLKIIQGNVADYEKVEEAVKGHDAVLSALGATSPFKFDQDVVDGAANIVKAMQQTGVKRFIYLSFIGVAESRNDAPFFIRHIAPKILKTEIAGHEVREKIIQQSNLDWTIVRPCGLTNGAKKGTYKTGEEIKSSAFIVTSSRADVADFMMRLLNDNDALQKKIRMMY